MYLHSVSYTHLDVYKRQDPPFLIFSIIHFSTVIINSVKDSILLLHPGFSGSRSFAGYPVLHQYENLSLLLDN